MNERTPSGAELSAEARRLKCLELAGLTADQELRKRCVEFVLKKCVTAEPAVEQAEQIRIAVEFGVSWWSLSSVIDFPEARLPAAEAVRRAQAVEAYIISGEVAPTHTAIVPEEAGSQSG